MYLSFSPFVSDQVTHTNSWGESELEFYLFIIMCFALLEKWSLIFIPNIQECIQSGSHLDFKMKQ